MKSILFASALNTTFGQRDYEILIKHFNVYRVISPGFKGLIKMLRCLPNVRVSFIWFASIHAGVIVFLSKLIGKKTIIALGGFDASKNKVIGYGIWNSWWRALIVGYAIRNADFVLAPSNGLKESAIQLSKCNSNKIEVMEFNYDVNFWKPGSNKKEKSVITVALLDSELRIKVKGIDLFIEAAKLLPDIKFKIVGVSSNFINILKERIPSNIELILAVPHKDLLRFYQRAKVYCQPSRIDSLPITLREAMLCGCVPVGTKVGGIPAAIGNTGWLLDVGDVDGLTRAINRALNSDEKAGITCRNQIIKITSSINREKRLIEIIKKCQR
ncbi:MAG: glycosyltransferase family 4 protein [Candidatus Cloacimonetes bacterium]|nr:glycosyltransferase family 4 protein [Candidatus Cloacimonadota bacterium]